MKLQIRTAEAFAPLLQPARYKGAWGGRGSGKSHFFAGLLVEDAYRIKGLRAACIREVQKSLKQSAMKLVEDKLIEFGLGERQGFKVFRDVIQTPGDGIIVFQGMQDHTADSIKSLEGFDRAWVEEAQSLSNRSMTLLRPTIRKEHSELWFSWNPMRAADPVDMMLRGDRTPTGSVVVKANWSDNPWLPQVLDQERRDCLEATPEQYGHIWEGEYAKVLTGAYYARHLNQCQVDGRIGFVPREQLNPVYAVWDIGGSSGKADATAIWIVQYIDSEVRALNYYESVGQPFDAHVNWLRRHDYESATCVLPHDGAKHDTVYKITPETFLQQAGFRVETVPNQGKGAAIQRVDAVRDMFPAVRFNAETTEGGREALGWYHEKRDEVRGIGLGPEHDWASHAADAFGLVAIYRTKVKQADSWGKPIRRNLGNIA